MTEQLTPRHLREVAEIIDTLTKLAAPMLHASKEGHTRLRDAHGEVFDLVVNEPLSPERVLTVAEWLDGTEVQDDLRRWADELTSSDHYRNLTSLSPLHDPQDIDPDGKHLRALVERMRAGEAPVGAVCAVYELCGHPVCEQSYNLWVEVDRATDALSIER